jgi:hypothetical protein
MSPRDAFALGGRQDDSVAALDAALDGGATDNAAVTDSMAGPPVQLNMAARLVDEALRAGISFMFDDHGNPLRWMPLPDIDPGPSEAWRCLCVELTATGTRSGRSCAPGFHATAKSLWAHRRSRAERRW